VSRVAIGIDLGTGGVRVVAIDPQGKRVAQATRSYPLLTPHSGWTEQNSSDWVVASLSALTEVAQKLAGYEVVALGLSGQMHGMVALNAEGAVVRPAVLWNDQRTHQAVAAIEAIVPRSELIQRTGNPAITGFQLAKLIWLRHEEPAAFHETRQVLLPKDYLGYVLTGDRFTEPSDASGVGCLNLQTRQWDTEILSALDLTPALFPPVVASTAIGGRLQPAIAAQIGLPAKLPVVAGGGDNAAAAIGLGISGMQLHQGSLSIGTSGVIFVPIAHPTPDPEGRAHLFCHVDGGYHLLGVTLAAGGSLRWYRDRFAPEQSYDELMQQASQSPPGARGVLFLPHLAGERTPYLDSEARGAWVNLALAHDQSDLIRAVLEGVAFSLRAAQEVVTAIVPIHTLLATGGGARSPLWLQILADVLSVELVSPQAEEGAAYGAALLAAVGVGMYADLATAIATLPPTKTSVLPNVNPVYEQQFDRFKALYRALRNVR
jgi:xylulokinase